MELTEHIAAYLRANGFPYATSGAMPDTPDRNAAVYASGLRPRQDDEGSRFEIIVRSERNRDTAIRDAMNIADMLDDFSGITSIDSPFFERITIESGVSCLGKDDNGCLQYSVNFRAWYC